MPRITRPQVYRVVREMLPRERLGPEELLRLLEAEQLRNERASRSHAKRRAALRFGGNCAVHRGLSAPSALRTGNFGGTGHS